MFSTTAASRTANGFTPSRCISAYNPSTWRAVSRSSRTPPNRGLRCFLTSRSRSSWVRAAVFAFVVFNHWSSNWPTFIPLAPGRPPTRRSERSWSNFSSTSPLVAPYTVRRIRLPFPS
jgi:hypothetical protein